MQHTFADALPRPDAPDVRQRAGRRGYHANACRTPIGAHDPVVGPNYPFGWLAGLRFPDADSVIGQRCAKENATRAEVRVKDACAAVQVRHTRLPVLDV